MVRGMNKSFLEGTIRLEKGLRAAASETMATAYDFTPPQFPTTNSALVSTVYYSVPNPRNSRGNQRNTAYKERTKGLQHTIVKKPSLAWLCSPRTVHQRVSVSRPQAAIASTWYDIERRHMRCGIRRREADRRLAALQLQQRLGRPTSGGMRNTAYRILHTGHERQTIGVLQNT